MDGETTEEAGSNLEEGRKARAREGKVTDREALRLQRTARYSKCGPGTCSASINRSLLERQDPRSESDPYRVRICFFLLKKKKKKRICISTRAPGDLHA